MATKKGASKPAAPGKHGADSHGQSSGTHGKNGGGGSKRTTRKA